MATAKQLALLDSQAKKVTEAIPNVLVSPILAVRNFSDSIIYKAYKKTDELFVTLWDAEQRKETRLNIAKRSKEQRALILIAKECMCSYQQIAGMLL